MSIAYSSTLAASVHDLESKYLAAVAHAERVEAALKRSQRRAPPIGWRASFDKRGWLFFNSDQKVATPIFSTPEEAVAAIEDGRVFAGLYEDEFSDRSPVSGLRAVLAGMTEQTELATTTARAERAKDAPCVWSRRDQFTWNTACGHSFWLENNDPGHTFAFCPGCGHPLDLSAT